MPAWRLISNKPRYAASIHGFLRWPFQFRPRLTKIHRPFLAAAAKGALEKIDFNVVDVSDFLPNTYTDYCIGSDVFATVFAWNTEKYGEPGSAGAPSSWADFWDVKKFPGTRAIRLNNVDGVYYTQILAQETSLEIA